jgi:hypothetical protein
MTESSKRQQARFNQARKRWPIVFLAILFVLVAIAGSVGYALYPFNHAGPGIGLVVCLLLRRQRP